ncbi:uncharacterized protein LOC115590653 [Sparus aurata]|uniref:uncharacterized protein LOC115590653 n=1 Tax=Sparus aurata TaxID=8175 RepID=UPI0011C17B07|nr:uncharacterized protein LOC115590653 [Sparus aurata]
MDGLHILLVVLLGDSSSKFGVVSYGHDEVTGSVLEVSVRPGDNITLYCDCKKSTGVYIVWYRNCSHENQPPFILKTKDTRNLEIFPRFMFVENTSSNSFDLLIMNVTESDEGIYYCGTQHEKVEERDHIGSKTDYRFGNITTRIILNSSSPDPCRCISSPQPVVSWMLVFSPAFTILLSALSFILVYHFFQRADKEPETLQKRPDTRRQTTWNQDEDVYFTHVVFRAQEAQTHQ